MASGSPETRSWTAPQKHSPEYVAIAVSSLVLANAMPNPGQLPAGLTAYCLVSIGWLRWRRLPDRPAFERGRSWKSAKNMQNSFDALLKTDAAAVEIKG